MKSTENRTRASTGCGPASRRGRGGMMGFTLIELMIVVVIISILAALVVPNMMGSLDKANVGAAKAQIRSFKDACITYKLSFKKYPASLEDLVTNPKQKFLDGNVPLDPWGNKYLYTCPGRKGNDFEIVSYGLDGQPGGTELNADIESWDLAGKQD